MYHLYSPSHTQPQGSGKIRMDTYRNYILEEEIGSIQTSLNSPIYNWDKEIPPQFYDDFINYLNVVNSSYAKRIKPTRNNLVITTGDIGVLLRGFLYYVVNRLGREITVKCNSTNFVYYNSVVEIEGCKWVSDQYEKTDVQIIVSPNIDNGELYTGPVHSQFIFIDSTLTDLLDVKNDFVNIYNSNSHHVCEAKTLKSFYLGDYGISYAVDKYDHIPSSMKNYIETMGGVNSVILNHFWSRLPYLTDVNLFKRVKKRLDDRYVELYNFLKNYDGAIYKPGMPIFSIRVPMGLMYAKGIYAFYDTFITRMGNEISRISLLVSETDWRKFMEIMNSDAMDNTIKQGVEISRQVEERLKHKEEVEDEIEDEIVPISGIGRKRSKKNEETLSDYMHLLILALIIILLTIIWFVWHKYVKRRI